VFENCLSSRNLFRSANVDEMVERCTQLLWPHQMSIDHSEKRVDAVLDGIVEKEFSLIFIKHGADVTIDAGEPDKHFLIQYNLVGHGICQSGTRAENTNPKSATILSPDLHCVMKLDEETEQLVLKLNRKTVESYLEDLILAPLSDPLVFDLKMKSQSVPLRTWENALRYIVAQCRNFDDCAYPGWDMAFAKMVIDLLLHIQPHNYSRQLAQARGSPRPSHLRRAQEYIHENCRESISMEALSRETGVTSRTLQNSFRKYLGKAPMDYVRAVKMQAIHNELMGTDADTSVSDVITKYNIYNLGRFAQRYKSRYGCLPSQTLKRGKYSS